MTGSDVKAPALIQSLKHNPATQQLLEQAKDHLRARSGEVAGGIAERIGFATVKAGEPGGGGSLKTVTGGAMRIAQGQSPSRAIAGAAGEVVKDKVKDKVREVAGAAGEAVTDKVTGAAGRAVIDELKGAFGRKSGENNAESMNIVESVDVGVPVSVAYDQWTQFQDFSQFMRGVEGVEQTSATEANWRARVFKSSRAWKATITEQIPDRRIVWTSEAGKGSTQGVVTFHPLADDLTLVLLSMRYFPQGLVEKTGNLWRAAGRRARLDLKNYRTLITSDGAPTGSWRGEIHDAEVTEKPDK